MRNTTDTEIIEKVGMLAWEMHGVVEAYKWTHLEELTNEALLAEANQLAEKTKAIQRQIEWRQNIQNN